MNKSLTIATLAVCALIALPVGAAQWMSYGSAEPDTVLDSPAFMWGTAPGPTQKTRIYFQAYATTGTTTINPNVAAVGTNFESVAAEEMYALLGVWTDCNGDGYIGLAETAAREYRSELLTNTAVCPPSGGQGLPAGAVNSWNGANNYAGWVTELIPIGDESTTTGDRRLIKDPEAAVWGDFGRYTDSAANSGGGTCAITPAPRGSMQSTGGVLTRADCFTGALDAWNTVIDETVADPSLKWADDDDGASNPTVPSQSTLGDADSENAIVKVNSCDNAVIVPTSVPDQEPGEGIRGPGTDVNPNGNVAGTVNYTVESMPLPTRETSDDVGPESTSNCNFDDDRGDEPYALVEGDFNSVSIERKTEADWNFGFNTMTRGGLPLGGLTGSAGAPSDFGLEPVSGCTICQQSEWFGGSTQVSKLPQTVATRGTVLGGDITADIAPAYWLSFYATVGGATTTRGFVLPGGGATAKYGQSQCGAFTSGVHNGWECDASQWNLGPNGSPLPDPNGGLAKPGKTYNLRDIDCYDGEVRGTGIGLQPAFFGPEPCRNG